MFPSQIETALLVFVLLVLYPNKNVPRQVTHARFIQNFPRNDISGVDPSERFQPFTNKEQNKQETKRERFLKEEKLKESSLNKRPGHTKRIEDMYLKKGSNTWEDDTKASAQTGNLDKGSYDKREKEVPLNLKNDNRIKIFFGDTKEDSQPLDSEENHHQETPKRERFLMEERRPKDSSFGENNKFKDIYFKKETETWESDNNQDETRKGNSDSSNRGSEKFEKEVPMKFKHDNRLKFVFERPNEDSPSLDSEQSSYGEEPKKDRFLPEGIRLKGSYPDYLDPDPSNRNSDRYEKDLPLKLKNDNQIKMVFEDSKDDSDENGYQEAIQGNHFLMDNKLRDFSIDRHPSNTKIDPYYKKDSSTLEDDDNNEKVKRKLDPDPNYEKYENLPSLKLEDGKQLKIVIEAPKEDSEQNYRPESKQTDRFQTENMKPGDPSSSVQPPKSEFVSTIYIEKGSKTWDSPNVTESGKTSKPEILEASKQSGTEPVLDVGLRNFSFLGNYEFKNETGKNASYAKFNFYSEKQPLGSNSTTENPYNTSVQGSSNKPSVAPVTTKETVLKADNVRLEVNTDKSNPEVKVNYFDGPAVNLSMKIQTDIKTINSTNQMQKKAANYSENYPEKTTELRRKKSEEGFGNQTQVSMNSTPRDADNNLKLLVVPTNLSKTSSEPTQLRTFVEVRNQLQPEKDMGSVIYVDDTKNDRERVIRETCDSLTCKVFSFKVLSIGMLIVFAVIGALVFLSYAIKKSSWRKYIKLKQGESSDENVGRSRSPKRRKKPVREDYSKPSMPLGSTKKCGSKPKEEMNHPQGSSEIKVLIESGDFGADSGKKTGSKPKSKANLSEDTRKRFRELSKDKLKYKKEEKETKRKEADKIPRQATNNPAKPERRRPPKPLEAYSTELSIEMTRDKKLKSRVMQWLQETLSEVEPEYPSLEEYKSELYCPPPGNSVEPKSSYEMKRLKDEVHNIIKGLHIPSEEIPQQLSHRELQKTIISTGKHQEVDEMLVGGKWGKSLLTGHGFRTIGHLKLSSKMSCAGPEERKDINLKKIAKYGANNEMGSTHSTQVTDFVREVRNSAEAGIRPSRRNRH